MTEPTRPEPHPDLELEQHAKLRAQIRAQSGPCQLSDLTAHLARAAVFVVEAPLDLIDVAVALGTDDSKQLEAWLAGGQVRRPTPDDLTIWAAPQSTQELVSAVVQPWVLVSLVPVLSAS